MKKTTVGKELKTKLANTTQIKLTDAGIAQLSDYALGLELQIPSASEKDYYAVSQWIEWLGDGVLTLGDLPALDDGNGEPDAWICHQIDRLETSASISDMFVDSSYALEKVVGEEKCEQYPDDFDMLQTELETVICDLWLSDLYDLLEVIHAQQKKIQTKIIKL